jgi:outer membrane protein assembly factor BamB
MVPSAREDHTWTADDSGTTAYLFGGRDGARVHGDLYAFDLAGASWRRLQPRGPRPDARFGHEAAWVDGLGLVVFAGQANATTFFGDLWLFDPVRERWRELPARGARPVPRYGTCSAIGADGRLWISHGFTEDGTRFFDTRAYDFGTERWSDETPAGRTPVARCLHGCFFADDGRFVLYAGQTTGVAALGDLWALDGAGTGSASWTQVEGPRPRDRNLYAFARIDGGWLVVGGRGAGGRALGDVHLVDAASLAVSPIRARGPRPPGRAGATLIPSTGGVFMFGGTDGRSAFRDLWRLELPASR